MNRVRLIHWNAAEAAGCVHRLAGAGFDVEHAPASPELLRSLKADPPDALVIDLDRLPSQGRDVAVAMRLHEATRRIPLVFVGGEAEKVAAVRRLLPDAIFTTWNRAGATVARAIARPPADPVVPSSIMAGYSGTPLPRKLGIRAGMVVGLVGAPAGFERTLGALPEGVSLRTRPRGACDLTIWFPRSLADLKRRVEGIGKRAGAAGLWIAWPKQASGMPTDLTQTAVRRAGLAVGLVDYKICAIDATWSALKFTRRRTTGPGARTRKP